MDDILRFPSVTRVHFIECGANTGMEWGNVAVPTVQYSHGMLGCSEWTGVPLSTLLDECGVDRQAREVRAGRGRRRRVADAHDPDRRWRWTTCWSSTGRTARCCARSRATRCACWCPGVQGVSSVKWLRRLKVGDAPWNTREESLHYVDLLPGGIHRQYTWIQEAKSVITSPSGGQVILDRGQHEITGLAWSGRGRVRRVDVSTDGGRNWRTARLQEPVLTKALTRFRIDWTWDGGGALLQSRVIDETGYVQPTLPAVARSARDALDLSQQRDPDVARRSDRRGEQCPGACRSACAGWLVARRAAGLVRGRLSPRDAGARRQIRTSASRRRAAEIAGWDIDVRARRRRPAEGTRQRRARGRSIYDAKCASCHGTFGESNSYLQIAGGVGTLALRRADPHDRQQAQLRDDAFRLHPARDAVQRAAVADRRRGLRAHRVCAEPQRHPPRRRGARSGFAAAAEDAEPRRFHDGARLHAPRRQARHRQRRVHEGLRRRRYACRPRCRPTRSTRMGTSPSSGARWAPSKA